VVASGGADYAPPRRDAALTAASR